MLWTEQVEKLSAVTEATRPWWEVGLMVVGSVTGFIAVITLVWKISKPHLDAYFKKLIEPAEEAKRQLTVNGGRNDPATVLDKLHNLGGQVKEVKEQQAEMAYRVAEMKTQVDANTKGLDDHITESRRLVAQIVAGAVTLKEEE